MLINLIVFFCITKASNFSSTNLNDNTDNASGNMGGHAVHTSKSGDQIDQYKCDLTSNENKRLSKLMSIVQDVNIDNLVNNANSQSANGGGNQLNTSKSESNLKLMGQTDKTEAQQQQQQSQQQGDADSKQTKKNRKRAAQKAKKKAAAAAAATGNTNATVTSANTNTNATTSSGAVKASPANESAMTKSTMCAGDASGKKNTTTNKSSSLSPSLNSAASNKLHNQQQQPQSELPKSATSSNVRVLCLVRFFLLLLRFPLSL